LLTKKSDVVLDPFAGSGTTAVVAQRLGRRFVAIELNEEFVQVMIERLQHG
jgi:DNA modification methylase